MVRLTVWVESDGGSTASYVVMYGTTARARGAARRVLIEGFETGGPRDAERRFWPPSRVRLVTVRDERAAARALAQTEER